MILNDYNRLPCHDSHRLPGCLILIEEVAPISTLCYEGSIRTYFVMPASDGETVRGLIMKVRQYDVALRTINRHAGHGSILKAYYLTYSTN